MLRWVVCLGLVASVMGCAGETSKALPTTVDASGKVTLDGAPCASAMITFIPKGGTQGIESMGVTDEGGSYSLEQVRGGEGVPPGDYVVFINRYVKPDGTPIAMDGTQAPADLGAIESLPSRYSNPAESTLNATVPEGGGEFNFDLTSK